jgi:hypothetical protein
MTTWVMIIIFQTQTANGAISATNIPGFASVQECFEAKNSISGVPGITESWRVSPIAFPARESGDCHMLRGPRGEKRAAE